MLFKSFMVLVLCAVIKCNNVNGITRSSPVSASLTVNNEISPVTVQPNKDLKSGESRLFNDPLPEYYKGPMSSAELDRDRNRDRYGLNRPDPVEHRDGGFVTSYGSATYGNNRYTPASGYGYGNRDRDRVSVGPYGSTGNSYYGGSGGSGGYGYDNPRGPYGPPQTVDYPRYGYGSGYDIHDNINGLDWGTGGGYADGVYGMGGYDGINIGGKHISKSHLIPLAGAALLGIAAILVANPMLLQLGVVSGKRKRRDISEAKERYSQNLAYNGHNER